MRYKMKKKKIFLFVIFSILFIFCLTIKVDALCTSKKFNDLKMTAYKSTVNYDLKFDEDHKYYFILTVSNVDKNILVQYNGRFYEPKNGVVEIDNKVFGGQTYEIFLYGGYNTACVEDYLYTKRITVPKYNIYSERDECIEYEEFNLCNKWYAGNIIDDEDFENQLDVYIKTLKKKNSKPIEKQNKNIFDSIIDFYTSNKIITVPITIIIILFVLYKIAIRIIRRKNRIKLNSK